MQTTSVSGGDATMTTITGLMQSTNYYIEVAAVSGELIGEYSDPMIIETSLSK